MRWIPLALLFALACRSTDPSFRNRSGERLSDLDPLPYRVAIANLESDRALTGKKIEGQEESLWFTFNDRGGAGVPRRGARPPPRAGRRSIASRACAPSTRRWPWRGRVSMRRSTSPAISGRTC